jgi:cytochrome P450 family 710 subfamily A protein
MRAGGKSECLVDFWMQDTLCEIGEAVAVGSPLPVHTDNDERDQTSLSTKLRRGC